MSPAVLHILQPGAFASVQDLGRPGWRGQGVPASGALHPQGLQAANVLAGQPPGAPAIELIGGQDKLLPERILTVDLGFLQQLDFGEFEIVGYLNRLTNFINPAPLTSTSLARGFDEKTGSCSMCCSRPRLWSCSSKK